MDSEKSIWFGPEQFKSMLIHVDELIPDPDNANLHPERNLEAIANSLDEFGQDQPLVVRKSDMAIIKGNGRWFAAKEKLNWTHMACIIVDEEKARTIARSLADNRSSDLSTWSKEALQQNFNALLEVDFDLSLIGFAENFYQPILDMDFTIDPVGTGKENEQGTAQTGGKDEEKTKQMFVLFEEEADESIVRNSIELICHQNEWPLPNFEDGDNMALYLAEICKAWRK